MLCRVNFIQFLTLLVGPLDSTVKYLNKLTWPRAETKTCSEILFLTSLIFNSLLTFDKLKFNIIQKLGNLFKKWGYSE